VDFIDECFIERVSGRLPSFKKVKPKLYNFRCPFCGDSSRSKKKARGYLYPVNNNTNYKCHNCGISISFNNFLKEVDPVLYKEFSIEKYKSGFTGKNFVVEAPKFETKAPVFREKVSLPKASSNSQAKQYLENRKLDPNLYYYAENFSKWVNSITEEPNLKSEPRIVIPLYYNKSLIGVQGRSIGPSLVKYITIMFDKDAPKIYNYDSINKEKPVYVLEGPFDSYFIKNSVAMCGADVDLKNLNIYYPVYVYDNEPRNKEIHDRMSKAIQRGYSIVIWPETIKEKDVNDAVLAGIDVEDVLSKNVYSNLEAQLKFNFWKKK
jgi:transcription elongation factor Elf1